jgi:hypothetical protein
MKRYEHLRDKAVQLRKAGKSLNDISSALSLSKTTVFYWIKDMKDKPIPNPEKNAASIAKAVRASALKYKKLRDDVYESAFSSAEDDLKNPCLRDFVCLYMGEGSKCSRNSVEFINSDPDLVRIAYKHMKSMTRRKMLYTLHVYPDHVVEDETRFWATLLGISPNEIKTRPKPGSNKLNRRNTRLRHGILKVITCDTYLKSRIDAYTDFIKKQWQ